MSSLVDFVPFGPGTGQNKPSSRYTWLKRLPIAAYPLAPDWMLIRTQEELDNLLHNPHRQPAWFRPWVEEVSRRESLSLYSSIWPATGPLWDKNKTLVVDVLAGVAPVCDLYSFFISELHVPLTPAEARRIVRVRTRTATIQDIVDACGFTLDETMTVGEAPRRDVLAPVASKLSLRSLVAGMLAFGDVSDQIPAKFWDQHPAVLDALTGPLFSHVRQLDVYQPLPPSGFHLESKHGVAAQKVTDEDIESLSPAAVVHLFTAIAANASLDIPSTLLALQAV